MKFKGEEIIQYWKCKQCIYEVANKRKRDIKTPLPDGIMCYREGKGVLIKDDNNECKFYCCEAM